jgi:hypothetical protein
MDERATDLLIVPHQEPILLERTDFHIRLASRQRSRSRSNLLIQRMYSWRGYKSSADYDARLSEHITLQACREEEVFGTVTLCLDSHTGLPADALYRVEIDSYRNAGAKVCELTRLAVDPQSGSKAVLGALFHLTYICAGLMRGATDVFIEVNPRHVSFYQRMLHFKQAGPCRMCDRVSAPAVLLHLPVAHVAEQIARYGGRAEHVRSSLYPYFFSNGEEVGLHRRLAATMFSSAEQHGTSIE